MSQGFPLKCSYCGLKWKEHSRVFNLDTIVRVLLCGYSIQYLLYFFLWPGKDSLGCKMSCWMAHKKYDDTVYTIMFKRFGSVRSLKCFWKKPLMLTRDFLMKNTVKMCIVSFWQLMLVKLASADSLPIGIWCLYHCTYISSFSIISSYRISQELISFLHRQLLLLSIRIWHSDYPWIRLKFSNYVVIKINEWHLRCNYVSHEIRSEETCCFPALIHARLHGCAWKSCPEQNHTTNNNCMQLPIVFDESGQNRRSFDKKRRKRKKKADRNKNKYTCETQIHISSGKTSPVQKELLSGKCDICLQRHLHSWQVKRNQTLSNCVCRNTPDSAFFFLSYQHPVLHNLSCFFFSPLWISLMSFQAV